jgi:hypothetical protein
LPQIGQDLVEHEFTLGGGQAMVLSGQDPEGGVIGAERESVVQVEHGPERTNRPPGSRHYQSLDALALVDEAPAASANSAPRTSTRRTNTGWPRGSSAAWTLRATTSCSDRSAPQD